MGLFDKIRGVADIPEDDDFYEDDLNKEEDSYFERKRKFSDKKNDSQYDTYAPEQNESKKSNKFVNIAATTQLSVVLVKPETFDEASTIADHLNSKRTVVLNLENANKELARRMVDFLSGVAYANQGQIKRVANNTFIITPYNVDFMGDVLDELESNGLYF